MIGFKTPELEISYLKKYIFMKIPSWSDSFWQKCNVGASLDFVVYSGRKLRLKEFWAWHLTQELCLGSEGSDNKDTLHLWTGTASLHSSVTTQKMYFLFVKNFVDFDQD